MFQFSVTAPAVSYDFDITTSNAERLLGMGPSSDIPVSTYTVDKKWDISQRDNGLFVTITSNRFFVSCVPAGEGLPTYENSMDFILWDSAEQDNAGLINLDSLKQMFYGYNAYFSYWGSPSEYYSDAVVADEITETVNFYKEMEIPEKEGYTFTGWYYDEACTRPYNGEAITADTNLYAGFVINKYTVTFDLREVCDLDDPNVGDTYFHTIEVEYGQIASYTPAPVEGKTFSGWFMSDGSKYENTPIKQDTELVGHWANIRYTITFDVNGGNTELAPMTVDHGTIADLPTPVRTGYAFLGWTCTNNTDFETSFPVTSDLSLKATWERNVFTVTFYVDNVVFKQIQVEYGQTLGAATTEVGIPKNIVVGFENVNTTTATATLNEFEIIDDVAVYLSQTPNIPDEPNKDNKTNNTVLSKIKQFLTDNWIVLTASICGFIVVVFVLVKAFKRKR